MNDNVQVDHFTFSVLGLHGKIWCLSRKPVGPATRFTRVISTRQIENSIYRHDSH